MILFFPKNKLSRLVNVSIFSIACENQDRAALSYPGKRKISGQGERAARGVGQVLLHSGKFPMQPHVKAQQENTEKVGVGARRQGPPLLGLTPGPRVSTEPWSSRDFSGPSVLKFRVATLLRDSV